MIGWRRTIVFLVEVSLELWFTVVWRSSSPELLPDVWAPHLISNGEPGRPAEETQFGGLCPQSHCFSQGQKMIIVELVVWDILHPAIQLVFCFYKELNFKYSKFRWKTFINIERNNPNWCFDVRWCIKCWMKTSCCETMKHSVDSLP